MHREIDFENEIEQELLTASGYQKREKEAYNPELALFPADVLAFVQKSQPQIWSRIVQLDAAKAEAMLLDSLVKELAAKGSLAVLRAGFKCVGKTVRLAYFAPNTGLDPSGTSRYEDNLLTVTRQAKTLTGAIPDLILALNGIPLASGGCGRRGDRNLRAGVPAGRGVRRDQPGAGRDVRLLDLAAGRGHRCRGSRRGGIGRRAGGRAGRPPARRGRRPEPTTRQPMDASRLASRRVRAGTRGGTTVGRRRRSVFRTRCMGLASPWGG